MGDDKKRTTIEFGFNATVWVNVTMEVEQCSEEDAYSIGEDAARWLSLENNSDTMWVAVNDFEGLLGYSVDLECAERIDPEGVQVEDALEEDDDDDNEEGADNG